MKRNIKMLLLGSIVFIAVVFCVVFIVHRNPKPSKEANVNETKESIENAISVQCGEDVRYLYDSDKKVLTVSGNGAMWDEVLLPNELRNAETLMIEDGVTVIGSYSFYNMDKVVNLHIADTVELIKTRAFGTIGGTVRIPENVKKIEYAGIGCKDTLVLEGDLKDFDKSAIWTNQIKEIIIDGPATNIFRVMMYVKIKNSLQCR